MKKNLSELLDDIPFPFEAVGYRNRKISGISLDSRSVNPGDLFVALKGGSFDGHQFIEQAIKQGAAAIIGEKTGIEYSVPYIKVDDSRKSATWFSAAFYDFPGKKLFVIEITNTIKNITWISMKPGTITTLSQIA